MRITRHILDLGLLVVMLVAYAVVSIFDTDDFRA